MSYDSADVFKLRSDPDKFKSLVSNTDSRAWLKEAHCGELAKLLSDQLPLKSYGPNSKELPDIPSFEREVPVLNDRALTSLGPLLPGNAEIVRVEVDGASYHAIGLQWIYEALDMSRSKYRLLPDGFPNQVVQGVFLRQQIDGELFAIAKCADVFATGKFLNLAIEHNLTGLVSNPTLVGRMA